jgi:hypothetical protein
MCSLSAGRRRFRRVARLSAATIALAEACFFLGGLSGFASFRGLLTIFAGSSTARGSTVEPGSSAGAEASGGPSPPPKKKRVEPKPEEPPARDEERAQTSAKLREFTEMLRTSG